MEFKPVITKRSPHIDKSDKRNRTPQSHQIEMVCLWRKSRLSKSEFCRQYDINIKTFSNWVKKLVVTPQDKLAASHTPPARKSVATQLELVFPNGVTLNLSDNIEPSFILSLIKAFAS